MNSAKTASPSIFPPIESWKAALMQLPEGPFFDILRSYLGDIKTPFNKQRLVDNLAAFLSRQEIQRRIAALLDETDRRCIAAVALLRSGTLQDLAVFFQGDYSFADLYSIILNLEERLIMYRTMEEGRLRLNLNPLLEPILSPLLQDFSILFPSSPINTSPPEPPVNLDLFLGALVAWLSNSGQVFKTDGSFKKKSQEELETHFALFGGAPMAEDLIHALEYLGILHIEEGIHHIDEDRLDAFASLESSERLQFLAAALIAVELDLDSTSRRLSRERLQSWARLIHRLLLCMQDGWVYGEQSLRRFWLVEELQSHEWRPGDRRRYGEGSHSALSGLIHCPGVDPLEFFRALLQGMETASLIIPAGQGYILNSQGGKPQGPGHPIQDASSSGKKKPCVVCDAGFSIIVYPEIPFSELSRLARFCRFQELGQTLKLELFQEGFIRALDRGLSLASILQLLEGLADKPVPQTLAWSLEEWTRRYNSAALYTGLVLVLAPERRYIAELDTVRAFIERELAPGVYFLRGVDDNQLAEVLRKAGLDTLARPEAPRIGKKQASPAGTGSPSVSPTASRLNPFARSSGRSRFNEGPSIPGLHSMNSTPLAAALYPASVQQSPAASLDTEAAFAPQEIPVSQAVPASEASPGSDTAPGNYAKKLLEDLRAKLETKPFTKEQKDELSARINRRLILDESQLVAAAVRYEKLEARGLDYVGKVRLVEQALSQGALIELFWRGPKGEPNRAIARPLALEKSGTELMIRGAYYPEGEFFSLPIGKISLLRRLKRSIFGE